MPSQVIWILGLIWNTGDMSVSLHSDKLSEIHLLASSLFQMHFSVHLSLRRLVQESSSPCSLSRCGLIDMLTYQSMSALLYT